MKPLFWKMLLHHSQELETLIDKDDAGQILYGDSANIGQEESIEWCGMTGQINEKGFKNRPLTNEQKASNRQKSKTRDRKPEHYPWSGHAAFKGRKVYEWQDSDSVLGYFGKRVSAIRMAYLEFKQKELKTNLNTNFSPSYCNQVTINTLKCLHHHILSSIFVVYLHK